MSQGEPTRSTAPYLLAPNLNGRDALLRDRCRFASAN
jgi:hypothetical protein